MYCSLMFRHYVIPFLLEAAAVLATFMGIHSLADYLKLQVVWVFCY
ncbi:hypothetical protein ACAS46_002436 [Vibrio vulnificus]